jgi:hypothetical protein
LTFPFAIGQERIARLVQHSYCTPQKTAFRQQKKTKNNLFKQTDKNSQEGPGREAAFEHITGQKAKSRLLPGRSVQST